MYFMIITLILGIVCMWQSITKDNDAFYALMGNICLFLTLVIDILYMTGVFK